MFKHFQYLLFSTLLIVLVACGSEEPLALNQACPVLPIHESVSVSQIQDGDTLRLEDGRRVRLIAINTPEIGFDNNPSQALAEKAKGEVMDFLSDTDQIHLHLSERKTDRYGRLLAHVYHPQKGNLEEHLVSRGLAFPIAVPPDLSLSKCLEQAANNARENNLGVWNDDYWAPIPATKFSNIKAEFRRVCGKVEKIDRAGTLWVELEGDVVIRINRGDQDYFSSSDFELSNSNDLDKWKNKNLEFWAWLQDRSQQDDVKRRGLKPWVAQVRSPYVLRWASSCD